MGIRVTTQMLGYSRRRAGLGSGSTLAKYLGGNGSNSYYNVLNNNRAAGSDRLSASRFSALNQSNDARYTKAGYEKLGDASEKLTAKAAALGDKVDGDGTGEEIARQAAELVDAYNDTLKNLKQSTSVLDKYYHETLKEAAQEKEKALEESGITVSSSGLLTLNRDKLLSVDGEKVKKMLGAQGDFLKKISFVSSRITDNAKANVESASSLYTSRGDIMNSYLSRFNRRS